MCDGSPSAATERAAVQVRPATDEWGCAAVRCLNAARFVVSGSDGGGWGACASHVQAVKKLVKEDLAP